jgi:hypothetical protein
MVDRSSERMAWFRSMEISGSKFFEGEGGIGSSRKLTWLVQVLD